MALFLEAAYQIDFDQEVGVVAFLGQGPRVNGDPLACLGGNSVFVSLPVADLDGFWLFFPEDGLSRCQPGLVLVSQAAQV